MFDLDTHGLARSLPLRIRLRAPRRSPLARSRRPLQPPLLDAPARSQAREDRRLELRDADARAAEFRAGGADHDACGLYTWG